MAGQGTQAECRYGCGYEGTVKDVNDHEMYMIEINDPDHDPDRRKV